MYEKKATCDSLHNCDYLAAGHIWRVAIAERLIMQWTTKCTANSTAVPGGC